ncbi:dual specificity protein phosphatase 14-like [Montipora foliosa]
MFKHCSPLDKMAEITDFLYIGGLAAAKMEDSLTKKGITCVINAATESPEINYESIRTTRIKLEDNPTCKIGVHFDLVADKIDRVQRERGKVLVHCIAGVSRSATLVLAYLMKHQKMKLIDAHAYVKKRRPLIRPNAGFWKDLVDYERKLFHKNSVDMVESKLGLIPSIYKDELKNLVW